MGVSEDNRATIGQILSGDIDAFESIVAEYKGLVFHVVRSMIQDTSEQEDVAQDVFVRVYESLRRFQFRCALATWISRIAYTTCLNRLRRNRSHPQDNPEHRVHDDPGDEAEFAAGTSQIPQDTSTPHTVVCRQELDAAVRESVNKLPPNYRLIVTLHYLDGFGIPELAQALGMPKGTIKSHLFRARALLKDDLLKNFTIEDLRQ